MPRSTRTASIILLLSATLSLSCASNQSSESDLIVKDTLEDLPNCSNGKFAAVYYVVSTDEFYFCNGYEFVAVDLSGQDGEDGQDGSSCTVSRDDTAGTTTVSCEDGTVAVIEDGQDGQSGSGIGEVFFVSVVADAGNVEQSVPVLASYCALRVHLQTEGSLEPETLNGCEIGQDPATNEWTIRAQSDGELVACGMVCIGLPEPPCPCFAEADILATSLSECTTAELRLPPPPTGESSTPIAVERSTRTLPDSADGAGQQFVAVEIVTASLYQCVVTDGGSQIRDISEEQYLACTAVIEDTLGPCETAVGCFQDEACNDGDPCTDDICDLEDPDAPFGRCMNLTQPDCAIGSGL
jgi:hypothetical protein